MAAQAMETFAKKLKGEEGFDEFMTRVIQNAVHQSDEKWQKTWWICTGSGIVAVSPWWCGSSSLRAPGQRRVSAGRA